MLAYPVSAKPIDYSKPVFIQPKLDGVRCLIQYEKTGPHVMDKGKVVAYSRTGKEWKNIDHILEVLVPFFHKYPNVVLDGELYNHDFKDDFEQIISMVRKTKPTPEARVKSRDNVQFHCYDFVNKKMKFYTRHLWLNRNLKESYCVKRLGKYIAQELIDSAKQTNGEDWIETNIKDHAIGELARCVTLNNLYLDREEYEKCAIMKLRIQDLTDILNIKDDINLTNLDDDEE